MILKRLIFVFTAIILCSQFDGCKSKDPEGSSSLLQLSSITSGSIPINLSGTPSTGLPINQPYILTFSTALQVASAPAAISLKSGSTIIDSDVAFVGSNAIVQLKPKSSLSKNATYTIVINSQLIGQNGEIFPGTEVSFKTAVDPITLDSYSLNGTAVVSPSRLTDVPLPVNIVLNFSAPVDMTTVTASTVVLTGLNSSTLAFAFSNDNKTITITRTTPLAYLSKYTFVVTSGLKGASGEVYSGLSRIFYSTLGDHTSGFPLLSDDQLLDKVQSQTVKYFYDFADAASGMAHERNNSGTTVTTGGTGFGLMAMVAGIDRGFIPRTDGVARFAKIVTFLEKADRFHGAWPHWIDGSSGKIIPFSTNDDGADLVETSFLTQGLITVRQYLTSSDTVGNNLINRITKLYNGVEWDWFRQESQKQWLYWHWSPDKAWVMNFALVGYFEEQVTYFLAASSPTHTIPLSVYENGFGDNGAIKTGGTYTYNNESYVLPLGTPSPLFWVQYSYLGLNPHFTDEYANYWTQNVNATLINHAFCAANPNKYVGYSDSCWGLTASDNPDGYGAQSPQNDNGTITPTAALSSFPYAPEQSMKALRFFYDTMGDRLWGKYGFYDAFNITEGWYADSYLAIDQGPIVVMIENYRSQLLWNLFMSAPEVQAGKTKLGFNN